MNREKKRVLLVSANTETDPHPVYPLGLDVLRAALARRGMESLAWDCAWPEKTLPETIDGFRPHLIGVSIRNVDNNDGVRPRYYLPDIFGLIADIKRLADVPIVLGGSGYSLFPHEILERSEADFGLVGPGENSLPELAERVAANLSPEHVPGLVGRNGARNPPAPPDPPFYPVPRNIALARSYFEHGGSINVQLKRGCPHNCVYCTYPGLEGRALRARPIEAAAAEIENLCRAAGVNSFFMVDSVFNLDRADARGFADELIRRGLSVNWTAFFMPRGLNARDVAAWRESGIEGVEFGVDTLAQGLLEKWGKSFAVRDVEESVALCDESDVPYILYLLFGGPGETIDTALETLERASAMERAVVYAFQGMRIYPGTRLHEIAIAEKVIAPDRNLLEPAFYFSPGLSRESLDSALAQFAGKRNWLVAGAGMEQAKKMSAFLRRGGRKGSLWRLLRPGRAADAGNRESSDLPVKEMTPRAP